MAGRIKPDDRSVPSKKGGCYYYRRYEEGKDYPVFCRKKGHLEAAEEIMLDGNGLAAGRSFFSVTGLEVSPDDRVLAYAVDTVSRGSAGGLLMGAVVNLRPDLFCGVVAEVPYVDVITTMLDPTIPLTTDEYDEWGNPGAREYYEYMLSYSPYDNVAAKDYPAMLVTTGLHDSQVQYWEPAKWVAKLRAMKTDRRPLLLYTNMDAGHGGASGRFRSLRETALEYAFLLDLAGIKE